MGFLIKNNESLKWSCQLGIQGLSLALWPACASRGLECFRPAEKASQTYLDRVLITLLGYSLGRTGGQRPSDSVSMVPPALPGSEGFDFLSWDSRPHCSER